MQFSRHRWLRAKFSTLRVGGTSGYAFWDANGTTWSTITADVIALTGSKHLTSADNILHWVDPAEEWDRSTNVGDTTGQTPTGTPEMFWLRINNDTAYSPAGLGSQFYTAPVLEESIVVAWLNLPLGNKSVHINGKHYMGRLIAGEEDTTSKLSSKNTDAFQEALIGTTVTGSGGDITISNGDGLFDDVVDNDLLLGGRIEFNISGYVTANSTTTLHPVTSSSQSGVETLQSLGFVKFRNATVEGIAWNDRTFTLKMMNETLKMDVPVLQNFFSVADYQNMTPDLEGKPIPSYWGNTETLAGDDVTPEEKWARGLPGTIVKPGTAQGSGRVLQGWKFGSQILNPETGTLHGFSGVSQIMTWDGNKPRDIPANDYDEAEGKTRINFKSNAQPISGEVRWRGQGYVDDAAGTFTGSANSVISKPQDVAHFILVCSCKYKTEDLDLASFTEAGTSKQGTAGTLDVPDDYKDNCSVYVGEDKETAREVINRLMIQMFAVLQPNNEGKLQISLRKPVSSDGHPANDAPVLFRHQTGSYEVVHDTDFMASNVDVKWRQFPSTNGRTSSDLSQVEIIPNGFGFDIFINTNFAKSYLNLDKLVTFETYMYTKAKVDALRLVYLNWFQKGVKVYRIDDIYGLTIANILGDSALLVRARSLGGELNEKQLWIITADRRYGKHGVIIECLEAAA